MARAKTTRSRTRRVEPSAPTPVPVTGPERYTATRFLSDCCDETYWYLVGQWSEGNQLTTNRVPVDGVPAVLILAAYAREYGVELVDDYEALIQRFQDHVSECNHPDKYLASCICILYERDQVPDDESFEQVGIPTIYEELLP